ncbi:MAG: hypothetical protein Q7R69_02205 [bacterium]|nr:hypothetical protein [bacterium]
MNIVNNDKTTKIVSVVLAVMFGVLFISLVANAVTTISTAISTAGNITTSAGNIEATAGTLTVGLTSTLTGDVTMSGGDGALTVTSASNSATSTLVVGCIEMHATSTVTPIHLTFASSTMATTSWQSGTGGDAATGLSTGVMLWKYGACPV